MQPTVAAAVAVADAAAADAELELEQEEADEQPDDDEEQEEEGALAAAAQKVAEEVEPAAEQRVMSRLLASKAKRGRGNVIGSRIVSRFLRGSCGASSKFSSHNGVPGRLPVDAAVALEDSPRASGPRPLRGSTSQGMMRGKHDAFLTPSPELSVERRETRRDGRDVDDDEPLVVGVAPLSADEDAVAAAAAAVGVAGAAAEAAPVDDEDDAGSGSLVLTSLTPLSLLPLSLDFFEWW